MSQHADEQSFLEHLETFRWHVIRAISGILVLSVVAFLAKGFVFGKLILGPTKLDFISYKMLCQLSEATCIEKLPFIIQSRKPTGQFTMHIAASLVVGFIAAFPYAFWEIWSFIRPALYPTERRAARGATFFVSILFLCGIVFGYFVITPLSVNFLSNYQVDPSISNEFDITSFVSLVTMLTLACGVMFQLPVVAYFLSKAGLIHPTLMRNYRRHSIVTILFFSALLTPPDVISQVLISLPLFALYEFSIFLSAGVWKKRMAEMNAQ